jgi:tetratricopeptide (TPR) repeat protein
MVASFLVSLVQAPRPVLLSVFFLIPFLLAAETAESTLDQGIEAFHKGQYDQAIKLFEATVKASPADARAITFLAITRAALGDCNRSYDELKLQAGRNSDPEIRRLAGLACIQCLLPHNEFTQIMPLLNQLQSKYPDDPDVIYQAARVYNKAWNFSIYDLFQKAPSSYRVNQLSAEIFETQGKYGEAATEYQKAIDKNPIALNLHYRMGRAILLSSHDPADQEKARAQFEEELKLNPGDAVAEFQIAQIYQNEQKSPEATDHYEKALKISPNFAEALVNLGKLRLEAKQHAEAVTLLERAVRVQPNLEAAHYNLMIAYRDSGKNKEAQREKKELDKLQKPPEGEFSDFLKKLGDKAPAKP